MGIPNSYNSANDAVSQGSEGPRGASAGALYLPKPASGGREVPGQGQAPVDPQRGSC